MKPRNIEDYKACPFCLAGMLPLEYTECPAKNGIFKCKGTYLVPMKDLAEEAKKLRRADGD